MKRKKGKKYNIKTIYIYSFIAIAITIIAISAIYQYQKPIVEKLPAEEYFEIRDAIPTEWDEVKSTEDCLLIFQIRFNMTAIGGDAHNIVITVQGMAAQEEWPYIPLLKQNSTVDITIPRMPSAYRSMKNPDGYFPFTMKIDSNEASGFITVLM